ncbi:MAG: hypothetical protein ACJAS4_002035 [Bacteriovoracaceae bacterium]|jgi:hypothetical protein
MYFYKYDGDILVIKKIICFFLFMTFAFAPITFAKGKKTRKVSKKSKLIKIKIKTKKKDSLAKLIRQFAKKNAIITKKTRMVQKTFKANPRIKNWRKFKPGTIIILYMDPKFTNKKKLAAYLKKHKKKKKKKRKKIAKKAKQKVHNWSVFYMTSSGDFTQDDSAIAKVQFKQNSPVTLGMMHLYKPKGKNHSISTSTYFSYLLATSSNLETDTVEVPLEIGVTSYFQKPFQLGKSTHDFYVGGDFERFNTFNLAGLQAESELLFDQNQLLFLTLGYSKYINFTKKFGLLVRTSFSQSVYSSRTIGFSEDPTTTSYAGSKFMFFMSSKVYKNYFISFLAKYHTLTGPSDVTSLRTGIGAGVSF